MLIPESEAKLFFELYPSLIGYATAKSVSSSIKNASSFQNATIEEKLSARNALFDDINILKQYINENPDGFCEQDLAIVSNWRHFIRAEFIVERNLKSYTVFLDMEDGKKAYGVHSLFNEISDMVSWIPILITTVLLPWKEQIIFDGLFTYKSIQFGSGYKSSFKDQYMAAKRKGLITTAGDFIRITQLDTQNDPPKLLRKISKPVVKREQKVGLQMLKG